jgi:hypothetical protein
MEDEEEQIRNVLSGSYMSMTKEGSFMFNNIDSFVVLSQGKTNVISVGLYPFDSDPGNYEFWDKVGEIVGNLTKLKLITIHFLPYTDDDDDDEGGEARIPDWETLTRILRYLRHKISLCSEEYDAEVEDIQDLARPIHGHPLISEFIFRLGFTLANMGPWCTALATLPSLESVVFGLHEPAIDDQRALITNFEPFKELLRTPALRFVRFEDFNFTNELCHATANALEKGSSISDITFEYDCSFPVGGRALIANALKRNVSVTDVQFLGDCDETFYNTLAAVLLSNSTLQNLTLHLMDGANGRWLSSIFLSLGTNTSLKSLSVMVFDEFGDELCAAIRNGLAKNSTLEELWLGGMIITSNNGDDGAVSARNALSFLRTNCTLKSFGVSFEQTQKQAFASAFRLEAVKMLENSSLESLTINGKGYRINAEEILALLSALQLNTTLKVLSFQLDCFKHICFTADRVNELVSILMKNFGLERLEPDIPCADDGTVKAILRLNRAGRRYLIKDGSSISKGVDVLSAVSDEIDCVFLHLLENPSLCDRRAAETTAGRRRPSANPDEPSSTGKRERALSLLDKEPRRRL